MSYISYLLLNLAILTTLVHLMVCYLPYHVNDLWLGMARLVATVVLVQGMNMSSDIIILINWACRHGKTRQVPSQYKDKLIFCLPFQKHLVLCIFEIVYYYCWYWFQLL